MCIILDTSRLGDYFNKDDFKPLRKWVENKHGRIVYSKTLLDEYKNNNGARRYRQRGIMTLCNYNPRAYDDQIGELESNDRHIIELALASGVKLLVSNDQKLIRDFKKEIGGKTYQAPKDKRLLTEDLCP